MNPTLAITVVSGAMSGMVLVKEDTPALVLALKPLSIVINQHETKEGRAILRGFCRELALEAGKVAAFLDDDAPAPDWTL